MSDGFTEGDMLVNTREVILVPPDRPIISIPFKNITELTKQEGADPHLSLSYYGNDGKQISFVLMSAAKKNRKSLNEAMLTAMRGLKT
jgi:hypothetical protein